MDVKRLLWPTDFSENAAQFNYDSFYVMWDRDCPVDDTDCMRHELSRADIAISQVSGNIGGARSETTLTLNDHGLPILFGMLARSVMTSIILPKLYQVDSVPDFLSLITQVFGGAQCGTAPACCSAYADTVGGDPQQSLWGDTKDACEVVSARLANDMNATLDASNASIGSVFGLRPLRIFSESPCGIMDTGEDGVIDVWGGDQPESRCQWRGSYYLSTGQEELSGTFSGVRQ